MARLANSYVSMDTTWRVASTNQFDINVGYDSIYITLFTLPTTVSVGGWGFSSMVFKSCLKRLNWLFRSFRRK